MAKLLNKFMKAIKGGPSCSEWRHSLDQNGYGRVQYNGESYRAHRLAWIIARGEIPPNMMVCHKCNNPACVNPTHLYVGTNRDNMIDAVRAGTHVMTRKTHCKKGHEFTPKNTHIRASDGARQCVECRRTYWLKYAHRVRPANAMRGRSRDAAS